MSNENSNQPNFRFLYVTVAILIVVWILSPLLLTWIYGDFKDQAQLGDSYGAINSLFSALTLMGLVYTIYLQREAYNIQKEDLDNTRTELNLTRDEFKAQNTTLKLQRFENTFFSLLGLHHQIVNGIDSPGSRPNQTNYGRDAFLSRYDALKNELIRQKEKDFRIVYMQVWQKVQGDFGHYFRNMYRIVKLIDETEFVTCDELSTIPNETPLEKQERVEQKNHSIRYKYTSILRAQLSDYELLWLCYNGLSDNGSLRFMPLIEKYSLLKNIPDDKLHNKYIKSKYKEMAFGDNKLQQES